MKFTVQRETILKPLQLVIGVVERRQTLPVLSNILLVAEPGRLSLTATDLEVELVAQMDLEVEETGEVTIPARKFLDICRTLPEGAVLQLNANAERAQLRSGKSRFSLSTLPATEFPTVEGINTTRQFTMPQGDLRRAIDKTQFSMAQQDVRYYLNGLMLEMGNGRVRAVATDGHRLALCEVAADIPEKDLQQVIVPRKGIQELGRLLQDTADAVEMQIGANHIRVQLPGLRFTSKLIDGRFPEYQRVIPKDANNEITADKDVLKQALVRTSILSNEKYRGIRLQLAANLLRIQAHNPEQEEAEEEVEVDYTGAEMEIGFNVNYMLDALQAIAGEKVRISLVDPNSSCLIQEPGLGDCKYVVMPMRL